MGASVNRDGGFAIAFVVGAAEAEDFLVASCCEGDGCFGRRAVVVIAVAFRREGMEGCGEVS